MILWKVKDIFYIIFKIGVHDYLMFLMTWLKLTSAVFWENDEWKDFHTARFNMLLILVLMGDSGQAAWFLLFKLEGKCGN